LIYRYCGLAIVFIWFFAGGIGHFLATDFFLSILPPYVPFGLAVIYLSGVVEILLAGFIVWSRTRPMAGWGLILLTIAVTPANIHMWLHPELFPGYSPTMLSVRLFIQVLLLLLIWWSTRVDVEHEVG